MCVCFVGQTIAGRGVNFPEKSGKERNSRTEDRLTNVMNMRWKFWVVDLVLKVFGNCMWIVGFPISIFDGDSVTHFRSDDEIV